MDEKIVFYIDHELRESIELYIIDNNLDREKITLVKLVNRIIKEWYKDQTLDEKLIFFAYRKGYSGRIRRLTALLTEEEYIAINRLYVRKYLRKIQSLNMMMANVIEQWAINNIPEYKEKYIEKFNIVDE